jgi:hypothetical protein
MAKKKIAGEINFYKSMAVLGFIVFGVIAYGFIGAAPNLSDSPYHQASTPVGSCLECHALKVDKNPIMPHRPMEQCTLCHRLAKKKI